MTHFIFGRSGSGKTERVCSLAAESLDAGRRVFLVVPEQSAVDAEQKMADILGDKPTLGLEILNFKRLCNRIFREYGGLSYSYVTKSGRALLMWQTLTELSSRLSEYGGRVDPSRVQLMLAAVSELKAYRVTPSALERGMDSLASRESEPEKRLTTKLSDLSLIFAEYCALMELSRDDPADDLTKVDEILSEHDFFAGADVYFDSFNGYTPQEFAILRRVMRQARTVTISLTLGEGEPFANLAATAGKLKRLAGEFTEELLAENHRHSSPELRFLERNLYKIGERFDGDAQKLRLVECRSLFSECESVAVDICRRVRNGAKYRDFAVTMRGSERFDGIIDVTLEKYGIPYFFSKRTDLSSKPLVKLILSALTLISTGWRAGDVVTYIKSGLTGLVSDELSALEGYAATWQPRGRERWCGEFTLDPRGYTPEPPTDATRETLLRVNSARKNLVAPLERLADSLLDCKNVRDFATALFGFLLDLELPSRLSERAEEYARDGFEAEAAECGQLWSLVCDLLDELVATLSGLECDLDTFRDLVKLMLDSADIGRIPATVDEVTVGDASLLRSRAKHIYVIGANEGIFPASPDSGGIFSDSDRERLAELGIELAGGGEYRAVDERFTFYRALTAASESLTVSWSSSDLSGKSLRPSFGALRLRELFPTLEVTKFDELPLLERLEGRPKLLEYAAEARGTPLFDAISRLAESDDALRARLAKLELPLIEGDATLDAETAKLISGGDLALTQSRLDSYVLCKFFYFCKYILKLRESKPADFDSADIGSFVHRVLELFAAMCEGRLESLAPEEIDRIVDEIVEEYKNQIIRPNEATDHRLEHLFTKLRRSSKLLCRNIADEFSQSEFRPSFYELPIRFSTPDEATVAPLEIDLGDGTNAYIYGIADRVDTFRRDGKLYVRVVDYKTGSKDFSLDDVAMGLNLQLLLYLFSLWKNGSRRDSALAPVAMGDEIVPAGVLYFSANVPTVTLDAPTEPRELEKMLADKLSRKGLLLDDSDVLAAMERELGGHYLPVKVKKDGSFARSDALKTLEDFGGLLGQIEETIRKIGGELKRGRVSARPMRTKAHDACKFCPMKPVCRKSSDAERN